MAKKTTIKEKPKETPKKKPAKAPKKKPAKAPRKVAAKAPRKVAEKAPKTFIRNQPFEVRVKLEVPIEVDAPDQAGALAMVREMKLGDFMDPNNSTVIKR